jgi:hypothetical protein
MSIEHDPDGRPNPEGVKCAAGPRRYCSKSTNILLIEGHIKLAEQRHMPALKRTTRMFFFLVPNVCTAHFTPTGFGWQSSVVLQISHPFGVALGGINPCERQ